MWRLSIWPLQQIAKLLLYITSHHDVINGKSFWVSGLSWGSPVGFQLRSALMFSLLFSNLNNLLNKQLSYRWFETPWREHDAVKNTPSICPVQTPDRTAPTYTCARPPPDTVLFLAATKQLLEHLFPSVHPSLCPSVRPSLTPFWQCSCHRIILKFSGVITIDRRDVHAKGQGQRSKVKVTEVMTPFSRFRTVIPVWIHIWWWNDA